MNQPCFKCGTETDDYSIFERREDKTQKIRLCAFCIHDLDEVSE